MQHLTIGRLLATPELGGSEPLSPAARQHLAQCSRCRETYTLVAAAATEVRRQQLSRGAPETACLSEEEIAAYLESGSEREQVELHLLRCTRCLQAVVDTYRMLGTASEQEPVEVPAWALRKARSLVRPRPGDALAKFLTRAWEALGRTSLGWRWAVAGGAAILVLAAVLVGNPELRSRLRPGEATRVAALQQGRPTLLSPARGSLVESESIQLRWQTVPRALRYRVVVLNAIGDTAWTGQTSAVQTTLARGATPLKQGETYFWTVKALMPDGNTVSYELGYFQVAWP
ncbi:MAG: hypothetical protein QHJ34_14120 [bacterium]|jgi:hypothetical protein|nr:hypothetical protein [candidate division KSB1 bacterium]MDH7561346.1 hypothetical protein [bacterium]